ncbi:WG repeat-containing protein [Flavobacterium adhaerens]|uniref:WG repeat-containing protein n=1 Tax=Flavobacterium adhaerens TaxID=3149043 RepID=UPI0032B4758D
MRMYLLLFFLINTNLLLSQTGNEDWIRFEDKKTFLMGYKNTKGEIKIKPKFTFITNAIVFKNIMSVFEEMNPKDRENSKMKAYYLLKNGRQIGLDSLYVHDFTLDCEQENKIRFRDPKTDKVGFFDRNGKVVIPAIYNDAKPFYNGFTVVITQGKRICWDNNQEFSKENPCEHWSWKGNIQIINDKNEVIADSVSYEKLNAIDWFSVKVNSAEITSNEVTFQSSNGTTYSFLSYEKQFENWFNKVFLKGVSENNVIDFLSDTLTYDVNETAALNTKLKFKDSFWKQEPKEKFVLKNKDFLAQTIKAYRQGTTHITEGIAPVLSTYENAPNYFSSCGEYQNVRYPYFQVYLLDKDQRAQKTLGFIREGMEFKLLEMY